jgi:hypothetical protein
VFRAVMCSAFRTERALEARSSRQKQCAGAYQRQLFDQSYFQTRGVAEKGYDADPKPTQRMFLYSVSGSIPKENKWRYVFGVNEKALDGCVDPKQLPAWLRPVDLDYYAEEYSRTGFRGGLNWYRGQRHFLATDAVF